ncbi:hypothetical protein [Saccharothrix lopnurensis]|uniref:Uncharacterized protein n=1 Tax=Saccharothrix lopnurensis TaxID=1670621 RepID=A0ABW1P9K6_9PSEU
MTSDGQELSGDGVVRLGTGEFDLLRQVVREVRELGDDQLGALGVRRHEVDDLRTAVRAVRDELADGGYTTVDVVLEESATEPAVAPHPEPPGTARVTGVLTRAMAARLPDMIHYVRDWLGEPELGHRTGSAPAKLDELAARFPTSG